eukprot:19086-Heterococcus_DN1.PRE.1
MNPINMKACATLAALLVVSYALAAMLPPKGVRPKADTAPAPTPASGGTYRKLQDTPPPASGGTYRNLQDEAPTEAPTAAPVQAPRAAAQTAKPTSYYPLVTQIPIGSQQPAQVNVNTGQPQAQSEEPAIPTLQPAANTVPTPTQPTEIYGTVATPEYAPPPT